MFCIGLKLQAKTTISNTDSSQFSNRTITSGTIWDKNDRRMQFKC